MGVRHRHRLGRADGGARQRQTLGEFFAEHLTGPLGMADTSFVPAESFASRRPAMHARLPGEALAAIGPSGPEQPEFEMGAAGCTERWVTTPDSST